MYQFIAGSQNLSSFCHSTTRIDIARKLHLVAAQWYACQILSFLNFLLQ